MVRGQSNDGLQFFFCDVPHPTMAWSVKIIKVVVSGGIRRHFGFFFLLAYNYFSSILFYFSFQSLIMSRSTFFFSNFICDLENLCAKSSFVYYG